MKDTTLNIVEQAFFAACKIHSLGAILTPTEKAVAPVTRVTADIQFNVRGRQRALDSDQAMLKSLVLQGSLSPAVTGTNARRP